MPKKYTAEQVDAIFDRLCDPQGFTGSHQHRFDKDGHGLGLQGRDPIIKGDGTHPLKPVSGKVLDIGHIMRVDLGPQDFTKPKYASKKAPAIFDRLLDPKHYTGTHVHRFDENGRGLGLQGRERIVKGNGTQDTPYTGGAVRDIGEIMRSELRAGALNPTTASMYAFSKKKLKSCRVKGCKGNRHPGSKRGLCSYHMWSKDEDTNYRKPGQVDYAAPQLEKRQICKVKKCGRKRMANQNQCEYHYWKMTQLPKGKGSASKVGKGLSKSMGKKKHKRTLQCSIFGCTASRFKMGYCLEHYEKLGKHEPKSSMANWLDEETSRKSKRKGKTGKRKKTKFTIFDKLTDPSDYTGHHRHRFNRNGKGRGLKGRDYIVKGGHDFPKHHAGETVLDISQILRPQFH